MPSLAISVEGVDYEVSLDLDGRIEGVGNPTSPSFTEASELPVALRESLGTKIRIVRHTVILPDNRPHTYLRGCIEGRDCTGHNIGELLAAYAAGAECIDYVDDPRDVALRASTVLAVDKGVPSHIEKNDYNGYDVVTDEGKRFSFRRV
jgi:hypothetical protein